MVEAIKNCASAGEGVDSLVVQDIREYLSLVPGVKLSFISRERNCVAHVLANSGFTNYFSFNSFEAAPLCVASATLADKA